MRSAFVPLPRNASRIVNRSSRLLEVGCSCAPSPALITEHFTDRASRCGAPDDLCRMIITSTPIASIVRAVSSQGLRPLRPKTCRHRKIQDIRRQPLPRQRERTLRPRRILKNRFTITFPCNRRHFLLIDRVDTSFNDRAVSRIDRISSALSDSRSSKCGRVHVRSGISSLRLQINRVFRIRRLQPHNDLLLRAQRIDPQSHVIRLDRKLPPPAIHQHRQPDNPRPPEIHEGIGAAARTDRPVSNTSSHRTSTGRPSSPKSHVRSLRNRDRPPPPPNHQIIPIHRDIQRPHINRPAPRVPPPQFRRQPLRNQLSARPYPHERQRLTQLQRRIRQQTIRQPRQRFSNLNRIHQCLHGDRVAARLRRAKVGRKYVPNGPSICCLFHIQPLSQELNHGQRTIA